jgi:tRNA A37 threonylcarbamoyladenosine synthetase subunit TsaC/SUA5/YrdC
VLTSANRSEESAPVTAWQAVEQLALHPGYVVDAGESAIGIASTIYDVSSGKVAREGHISEAALNSVLAPNT